MHEEHPYNLGEISMYCIDSKRTWEHTYIDRLSWHSDRVYPKLWEIMNAWKGRRSSLSVLPYLMRPCVSWLCGLYGSLVHDFEIHRCPAAS